MCFEYQRLQEFSKLLNGYTKANNLKKEEMAELTDVEPETVNEWLKAQKYPEDSAKKVLIDLIPELKEYLVVEEEIEEKEVVKKAKKKSQTKQFTPLKNTDPDSLYSRSLTLTGAELRTLRQKAGLTQEQLGAACNYSAANISSLESREKIYFQSATRLLATLDEVLGVPEPIQERSVVIEDTKTLSVIMRVYLEENAITCMATPAVILANQLLMQASGQTITVKEGDFDALREVLTTFTLDHIEERITSREMALANQLLYDVSDQAETIAA